MRVSCLHRCLHRMSKQYMCYAVMLYGLSFELRSLPELPRMLAV